MTDPQRALWTECRLQFPADWRLATRSGRPGDPIEVTATKGNRRFQESVDPSNLRPGLVEGIARLLVFRCLLEASTAAAMGRFDAAMQGVSRAAGEAQASLAQIETHLPLDPILPDA